MTAPVGTLVSCSACGKRSVRRQNRPDFVGEAPPGFLACSSGCAARLLSGEFGPWRRLGWVK